MIQFFKESGRQSSLGYLEVIVVHSLFFSADFCWCDACLMFAFYGP